MEVYKVKPFTEKKDIVVSVPGSKSLTNRALLMAALSDETVLLKGVLFSDDSRYFLQALKTLGFSIEENETTKEVVVHGNGRKIPKDNVSIYVGSAGTAARFLTAMLGLSGGMYTVEASAQMKKRPMKALFEALEQLGVQFEYMEQEYFLPVRILGRTEGKNKVRLDISQTSQPLSALLMTGMMLTDGLKISVTSEKKAGSYVEITRRMMEDFGISSTFDGETYEVSAHSQYHISMYQIEPDVSAACYFYGIAAITGGSALVKHVHMDTMQGDIRFVKVLERMGCSVADTPDGILVKAPLSGKLQGLTVDMNNFSDQALTLAVVSIFAESPVVIENIGHIRLQECDRIHAIAENMKRLNIRCEEDKASVTIYPGDTVPAEIETYDDHRVAMAFTMAGLVNEGITILNPMCCRKTFENYYDIIETL